MDRNCNCNRRQFSLTLILQRKPQAAAVISGSEEYPDVYGLVRFYDTYYGTIVYAEINGLPQAENECGSRVLGFHIHGGTSCTGDMKDPFANAMTHYNPDNCSHPYHAGDMPPLFGCNGKAISVFLTNRFSIDEVEERTIIIHDKPDDFKTQPSGDSGNKIACGVIRRVLRNL